MLRLCMRCPTIFRVCIAIFPIGSLLCQIAIADEPASIQISVDPTSVVSHISPEFIGLGYETSAVAQADFFTGKNTKMVNLYRTLTTHGLIRIGGNVSDHTRYVPDGTAAARSQSDTTIINKTNLADLAQFSKATGWPVMWGLNLGTGSKEEAVQEAVDVTAALGSQLHSFQIGNEVDFLPRFKGHYDNYYSAFGDYKTAIRAALPDAPFSGPDSAASVDWIEKFAGTQSKDVKLLTHHYYVGGARDPSTSIEKMLKHDDRWEKRLAKLKQICQDNHTAFRINEVNSFSGGGKAGISDTFAEALWCLDYMFQLASYGCAGVNMETDINHLAWISHYSPIVHDQAGNCSARPEYYGMLAFAMAGKGDLLKVTLDKGDLNLSAFATKDESGSLWITIINKDLVHDAAINITIPASYSSAQVARLIAPSAESTDHVTFAGTEVAADGTWSPGPLDEAKITAGTATLQAGHASAMVICLKH